MHHLDVIISSALKQPIKPDVSCLLARQQTAHTHWQSDIRSPLLLTNWQVSASFAYAIYVIYLSSQLAIKWSRGLHAGADPAKLLHKLYYAIISRVAIQPIEPKRALFQVCRLDHLSLGLSGKCIVAKRLIGPGCPLSGVGRGVY